MPSYPRITRTPQVFVPNQSFEQFIVINGRKVRPFERTGPSGTTVIGWEQEVDGQWTTVADREFSGS